MPQASVEREEFPPAFFLLNVFDLFSFLLSSATYFLPWMNIPLVEKVKDERIWFLRPCVRSLRVEGKCSVMTYSPLVFPCGCSGRIKDIFPRCYVRNKGEPWGRETQKT